MWPPWQGSMSLSDVALLSWVNPVGAATRSFSFSSGGTNLSFLKGIHMVHHSVHHTSLEESQFIVCFSSHIMVIYLFISSCLLDGRHLEDRMVTFSTLICLVMSATHLIYALLCFMNACPFFFHKIAILNYFCLAKVRPAQ